MIHVNLLPEELRKIERVRKVKINVAILTGGAVAVALVIIVIVFFIVGQRMRKLNEVRSRLRAITPQREEAESLIKKKQQLVREIETLDGFSAKRLLWGRKLNSLSDAMPEELFLKIISYTSRPPVMLTIKGEAVPGQGNEKVVDYIETLRRNSVFISAFPQVDYSIESLDNGRKSFEIKCTQPGQAKEKK
jgi:hypothetical protein